MKNVTPVAGREVPVERKWYLVDADGKRLGRLASEVAQLVRGKTKVCFTPYVEMGDFVVVVNAERVVVTGLKADKKLYRRHSGRPGGMKVETFKQLQSRIPVRIIEKAVRGMLPKNALGRKLFSKLKVYSGPSHPHQAQQPQEISL